MKATPHRSGGKTGGGRTGPNYDSFLRIATNRLPGDHALHRPPACQANLRDGLLLSLRLGEPRRTGAAYRVTPAACVIAPESADSTARAEQDWDGSGFSRLPKIAPIPDFSYVLAAAASRSAIHTLMIDWRVTPSRPASRSSDSIIQAGKSTFTLRCSRSGRRALPVSKAPDTSFAVSNARSNSVELILPERFIKLDRRATEAGHQRNRCRAFWRSRRSCRGRKRTPLGVLLAPLQSIENIPFQCNCWRHGDEEPVPGGGIGRSMARPQEHRQAYDAPCSARPAPIRTGTRRLAAQGATRAAWTAASTRAGRRKASDTRRHRAWSGLKWRRCSAR